MDNIPDRQYYDCMDTQYKKDGFKDEILIVIPTESFSPYLEHPLVRALYLTDVGYFPSADHHFRERKEGISEYILIYCIDGQGSIVVNDVRFELTSKQVFCIPRHTRHLYYADSQDPWSILWVHFKGDNAAYFPLNDLRIIDLGPARTNERLMYLFRQLIAILEQNYTLGNFIYASNLLTLILSEVYFREKESDTDKQNQYLTRVIRYMYNNLDKDLTLASLADHMQLSRSYLNSIFKKYARRSPVDFFIHLKMQQACKYLKMTDLRIYEVSIRLGYQDPYYFSRIFKKVIGVSPREYKHAEKPFSRD